MPKLKKLRLQGFKSFAEPLTLVFPTGITAIVGPNGSGKSNVADAIRWVLGEQRMTTLRGSTNEDMIFAGSAGRARAGLARVTLTFDNSDEWLPLDFAEITVERRYSRDGRSDYILNGSKVRLMDLRDILDRAGLGRDAYLTIGQGLVDQVLSLRASERLALFEQAAGIAPYRNRREESLDRLDETGRNLERVRDIIGEIEPRLRRLERQVERAAQHAQLSELLRERQRIWYGYRWGRALEKLEAARQRVRYRQRKTQTQQDRLTEIESQIKELRQTLTETRRRLAELHRESSARHAEAEAAQRELAVARERRRLLQERQEESRSNLVPLRNTLEAEKEERDALRAQVEGAENRLAEGQAELAAIEAEYHKIEAERRELLKQQSKAQSQALESRHQLADRQSRLEQLAERKRQLARRGQDAEAKLAQATERRRAQQAAVEEARRALEQIEAELEALTSKEIALQAQQDEATETLEQLRAALADKKSAYQQLSARLNALEQLHAEGAGLYAGVRAVLQAAERGELQGLPGTFASLIRVPPQLDRAMETALGSKVQNVVARSWDDAHAAIQWLKQHRAGRATFLPLDNLRPSRPLNVPNGTGVIGIAAALVTYDDPALEPAVRLLLGRVVVTENLDAARSLYRRMNSGCQIVTLDGEILRSGGSVTGGRKRQKGQGRDLLARERERRRLPEEVETLKREGVALRQRVDKAQQHRQSLREAQRMLRERLRAKERDRQTANRQLEKVVNNLEKMIQETDWQRQLQEEANEERERLQTAHTRLTQELQEVREQLQQAEEKQTEFERALGALEENDVGEVVSERRTRVALLHKEHENQRTLLETRQKEIRRLEERIAKQEQRIASRAEELARLDVQIENLRGRYEQVQNTAELLSSQIPELETRVSDLETQQTQQETQESRVRSVLHEAEHRLSQAEIDLSRHQDRVQALRDEIQDVLDIVITELPDSLSVQQPLPLSAHSVPFPIVTELPEGLGREIQDLRTQIRRLEPVNPAAQEEYDEVAERHRFLREQSADLETASAHLRQVIAELDNMMETAFRTTFQAIADEFSEMFKSLFNGGTAKLSTITDEGEVVGVEITARPPGKRTSGLGMLSGGERSLTAVALLFAVLRISPTPFCILDEVDAMLDEANVGRFRAMLRELGKQIQFITITHNRGTVEVADTIYGVSMGDDGVSQVLSLSLEDLPASEVIRGVE